MRKITQKLRFKSIFMSAALAMSVAACSSGSGDAVTDAKAAFESHQYSAARIYILSALKEDSANPNTNLLFGKILLKMGDGEGAAAAFKKVMSNEANKAKVLPYYAHALLLSGASEKILELIKDPSDAKSYWVKACAFLDLGRGEEALAVLDKGLAASPTDVDLLVLKSKYFLTTGDMENAERTAALALKAGPDELESLQFSGRLAMLRQDAQGAEKLFVKAAKLYPESIPPLFSLAAIYADLGDEEKSRSYFDQILKAAPNHPLALFMLAKLAFEDGKAEESHKLLQRAGEGVADVPEAMLLKAKIANKRGNYEIAINRLQRYMSMTPGSIEGVTELGKALFGAGNVVEAYRVVKPAAMQVGATPELLALAAELAKQQSDPMAEKFASRSAAAQKSDIGDRMKSADAAILADDWRLAETIYAELRGSGHSDNPMILNNSALVALETGDTAGAQRYASEANKLAPNDAFIKDTLGWILLQTGGDKAQALSLIREAAAAAPGNREILEHLAEAFTANGDQESASQVTAALAKG